jgi:hypothetical protein
MIALLLILIDAGLLHRRSDQRTDDPQTGRTALGHLPFVIGQLNLRYATS